MKLSIAWVWNDYSIFCGEHNTRSTLTDCAPCMHGHLAYFVKIMPALLTNQMTGTFEWGMSYNIKFNHALLYMQNANFMQSKRYNSSGPKLLTPVFAFSSSIKIECKCTLSFWISFIPKKVKCPKFHALWVWNEVKIHELCDTFCPIFNPTMHQSVTVCYNKCTLMVYLVLS